MASIGWIDFSKEDRQKVGTVLDLLKPEGMVDELGIGTIRDAISDQLFPGISTIQTRAKYFFIVPYILWDYIAEFMNKEKRKPASKYLDDKEQEVMWELAEKYNHDDAYGVIGITKRRPNKIMRRPSEIYWGGLNRFNFINSGGLGVNAFLNNREKTDNINLLISSLSDSDNNSSDDRDAVNENTFRINIPPNPGWRRNLTMDLTESEADTLKNRIKDFTGDKLIGEILKNDKLKSLFRTTDKFHDFAKTAVEELELPAQIKNDLGVAYDYSEVIYGAHIVYNYLVQNYKYEEEIWLDKWNEWIDNLKHNMISFTEFDPHLLFKEPYSLTTKIHTQRFVIEFWNLIKENKRSISDYKNLIIKQEYDVKSYKARLKYYSKENNSSLDDIKHNKWVGMERLSYRYENARVILGDIFNGSGE